jgi:hypothetical protein
LDDSNDGHNALDDDVQLPLHLEEVYYDGHNQFEVINGHNAVENKDVQMPIHDGNTQLLLRKLNLRTPFPRVQHAAIISSK